MTAAVKPKPRLLDDVTARLRHALTLLPSSDPAARDVQEALDGLEQGDVEVKAPRAAQLLGVSSSDTVKNWARAGRFLHARQTAGGHWLFQLDEVLTMRLNRDAQRARAAGVATTPEYHGEDPFTL